LIIVDRFQEEKCFILRQNLTMEAFMKSLLAMAVALTLTACGSSSDDVEPLPTPTPCADEWVETEALDDAGNVTHLLSRLYSICPEGKQERVITEEFTGGYLEPMPIELANYRAIGVEAYQGEGDLYHSFAQEIYPVGENEDGSITYARSRYYRVLTSQPAFGDKYWSFRSDSYVNEVQSTTVYASAMQDFITEKFSGIDLAIRTTQPDGTSLLTTECLRQPMQLNYMCIIDGMTYPANDLEEFITKLFMSSDGPVANVDQDWAPVLMQAVIDRYNLPL